MLPYILASAGKDCSVRLWNIYTKATILVIAGLELIFDILCVEFDHKGKTLAVAGIDHKITIWNIDTDEIKNLIILSNCEESNTNFKTKQLYDPDFFDGSVHDHYIDGLVWFGENVYITKACDGKIVFWRVGEPGQRYEGLKFDLKAGIYYTTEVQDCTIWFIRINHDRNTKCLALGDMNGRINLFDLDMKSFNDIKKTVIETKHSKVTIRNTTFSNNGKTLIACNEHGQILRFEKY